MKNPHKYIYVTILYDGAFRPICLYMSVQPKKYLSIYLNIFKVVSLYYCHIFVQVAFHTMFTLPLSQQRYRFLYSLNIVNIVLSS